MIAKLRESVSFIKILIDKCILTILEWLIYLSKCIFNMFILFTPSFLSFTLYMFAITLLLSIGYPVINTLNIGIHSSTFYS